MLLSRIAWVVPIIIGGCSTSLRKESPPIFSLKPPTLQIDTTKDTKSVIYFLEKIISSSTNENERVWASYKLGQIYQDLEDQKACPIFTDLAKNFRFPLHNEAQLHQAQSCKTSVDAAKDLNEIHNIEEKPWLKELSLDVAISLAEKNKLREELLELYLEKSKLPLEQKEKVEYSQKAFKIATRYFPKRKKEIKNRIEKLSPMYIKHPKRAEYLKVAADLRRNRKFEKALWFYKQVAKHPRQYTYWQQLSALKGVAKTYKVMGNKIMHVNTTQDLALFAKSRFLKRKNSKSRAQLVHDTYLALARANWTLGNIRLARKTLDIMTKLLKGHYSLAEPYWISARMKEERQQFDQAVWWLEQATKQDLDKSNKEKILWSLAWNLRKLKKYELAIEHLKTLASEPETEYNTNKYKFWLAKIYQEQQQFDEAQKVFSDVIADDPLGYYGLLALRETHEVLTLPSTSRSPASKRNENQTFLSQHANLNYINWLISLDETEMAKYYLDHVVAAMKKSKDVEANEWLEVFGLYAKSGNYLKLFIQLGSIESSMRKQILSQSPDLIFPKPFYPVVSESARRYGVSIEYIYSIMRQESAFNPKARSHMDALGLMQLLPKVAKRSAIENKIPMEKDEDLYKPQYAIPLGAAYLRKLWDKYEGKFILATASYNANDKAIKNWIETRYRGDTLEFIEDIPYQETRKYVKLVMRNLIFYKIVNSREKMISFPNWALNI